MKIISWNVNGIRAILKKDFMKDLKSMNPDILCLQETKAHPEQVEHDIKSLGYEYEFWNSAEKKGYSGTAIFSKTKPIKVTYDINNEELNKEGRVITAEYENFILINVYTPNSGQALLRLSFRKEWDNAFRKYISSFKKTVYVCGDLNVAHHEIDLKNDKANRTTATKPGSAGFTDQEREDLTQHLEAGFKDTFRHFYPEEIKYSWWSYRFFARKKNVGWRIDYFLTDNISTVKNAFILNDIIGSDHCPVGIDL